MSFLIRLAIGLVLLSLGTPSGFAESTVQEEMITLEYPNSPVTDILPIYERLTGKRLIKDANLTGPNLSIVAPQPMPKSEAIRFIEAALILNGYSLVPADDNSIKVLSVGKIPRSEALPLYANAAELPKGDEVVSYFMQLRFISSTDAANIFQQHIKLHAYGSLVPVPASQAILITENASVIRGLLGVQELIDVPPARVLSEFVLLERADAARVAEVITKLVENRKNPAQAAALPPETKPGAEGNAGTPSAGGVLLERNLVVGDVQLIPDERTNRILVITRPVNMAYIKSLIRELDLATQLTDPVEIQLKYVFAGDVLPVLQNILSEGKETGTVSSAPRSNAPSAQGGGGQSTLDHPDQLGSPTRDVTPESVVVGKTRIIANKTANSLLVLGPPESVQKLRAVLKDLDKRPLQVYLSTVIGQLRVDNNTELGVDLLQKFAKYDSLRGAATGVRNRTGALDLVPDPRTLVSNAAFPLPAGLTYYATFGRTLDMFVKALASDNDFKIIARPVVYTSNNKKAVISSGQQIPVPTSTLSSLTTGATNNNTAVSASIDFKDVVLKLEVIPIINANKEVTLDIAQQNDSVIGSTTISGNTVPTIGTQDINTSITVPNRATIVMGGLVTDSKEADETGVPFLKDIPVLGYFFKDRVKTNHRSELIIMIQPTVIETDQDLLLAQREEEDRQKQGPDVYKSSLPPPIKHLKKTSLKSPLPLPLPKDLR